jgi:hypothetical protein
MIRLICPKCGNKLTVADEAAGKTGKCPCGEQIQIPVALVPILAPARRILGLLALFFGSVGAGLATLGIVLYFVFWLSFDLGEKAAVIAGLDFPGAAKLLLPKMLNYLAIPFGLAGIVLGILSLCLERAKTWAVDGLMMAGAGFVRQTAFWVWTVTRHITIQEI